MSSGNPQNKYGSKPSHQQKRTPSRNGKPQHKKAANTEAKPAGLHPNNIHQGRYDFDALEKAHPALAPFVIMNPHGDRSVTFSDPKAVLALNEALLKAYYGLDFWQIPPNHLCPPIPGRADYIHYLADLLAEEQQLQLDEAQSTPQDDDDEFEPRGNSNRAPMILDIGTGANCIYPILGSTSYDWKFVGTDIDPVSIKSAQWVIKANKKLNGKIKLRLQQDKDSIFHGVIKPQDQFAISMCNPPFHASMEKATEGSLRKVNNLSKGKAALLKANQKPVLNFAGTENELCYEGGEIAFLEKMANESTQFALQVTWFTTLVSKTENVEALREILEKLGVRKIKVVPMAQGHKVSRFVAWKF
ncbi:MULTISPECIES: 23S rRNA (adenine(1618)-N(6))-methyltransferase RlmF [Vibrio]|uniref:Ribosomal RNA large subunit methyltransferase F n=1 Tax=Vibrio algicola TaxID=2662262 RepID=A0A5Q0TKG5_9VIBR|nr:MULTISPECIES: 23S rRNA (adenine(1618)-N(6))-methyltransferase RlmF [Vibrio]MBD1577723.1 23S rRNA (adenine(1618)-N(6))-methyltransferase RlmF [Vibrio sp. S11_S32]